MNKGQIEYIELSKIIVNKEDNIREDYGDLSKLQKSMGDTSINIVSILVSPKKNKYKLIY